MLTPARVFPPFWICTSPVLEQGLRERVHFQAFVIFLTNWSIWAKYMHRIITSSVLEFQIITSTQVWCVDPLPRWKKSLHHKLHLSAVSESFLNFEGQLWTKGQCNKSESINQTKKAFTNRIWANQPACVYTVSQPNPCTRNYGQCFH